MNGVTLKQNDNVLTVNITYLSDDLKDNIIKNFREICHGEQVLNDTRELYSLKETMEEFISRVDSNEIKKLGHMGELLLHVLLREYTDFKIASLFFNMEERSAKKGFDIIVYDQNTELWLAESKAGRIKKSNDVSKCICEKINYAKSDIYRRLNERNRQLWLNASYTVGISLNDCDEKTTILNILGNGYSSRNSNDYNVILSGTIFHTYNDIVDHDEILKKKNEIDDKNNFKKLFVVAINSRVLDDMIDFFKQEVTKIP